ncbi:MAG TPA: hypothetical protein VHW24_09420 [Bryobacteraceae bacterium]|jgi:hypothetical protein|nr:hypothetical protein [Bryobacteraceae bacterium]
MYLLLRNSSGRVTESLLLAAGRNTIRVVLHGVGDTLELSFSNGQWRSDRDETFEIEALTSGSSEAMIELGSLLRPQTMTAGSSPSFY